MQPILNKDECAYIFRILNGLNSFQIQVLKNVVKEVHTFAFKLIGPLISILNKNLNSLKTLIDHSFNGTENDYEVNKMNKSSSNKSNKSKNEVDFNHILMIYFGGWTLLDVCLEVLNDLFKSNKLLVCYKNLITPDFLIESLFCFFF